ncbi:FMN-binding negative transcriptional regulator [uncultured Lentibacter sp.]|uniref:FMN-binding negative transcriptional regulator n=1 Tax=uncultured Lentibacter sp. TaxID=1659309 RepID=UPI0026119D6E|nr:FMN-binding negative transcriptional regulator [uncultured Lentibacter sp.]
MHPNPAFRTAETVENLAFARAQSFGLLSLSTEGAPLVSHIPFQLSQDGTQAELHLVRSTEITRALTAPAPARLIIQGPHSYISPDWYGLPDQVPTWNYVAVHLTGTLERLPDTALEGVLARLSAQFEARLAPKPAWRMDKMTPDVLAKMMRQIVPFRLLIETVEGTWKLGQNKPDAARLGGADGAAEAGLGLETAALAALMRSPPA